jgi:hypothetical protein
VCTDADEHSVSERARHLATALQDAGEPPRRDGECVAHWIPRWHLETWVYLYTHGPIDEDTDYKKQVSESDHQDAAVSLDDDLRRSVPFGGTCCQQTAPHRGFGPRVDGGHPSTRTACFNGS